MPKPTVTREQADQVGRIARKAGTGGLRLVADAARYTARVATRLRRAVDAVPPTVRLLAATGVVMLLGIVGALVLRNSFGLACIVVVVPVCSITLGAVGYRYVSGLGPQPIHRPQAPGSDLPVSDLRRAVEYVDKKLTFALDSFGADNHQQAMIALFQAKTAVELTRGTEQDAPDRVAALLSAGEHNTRLLRPVPGD